MDQLSGLDNSFLLIETGAQLGHVAAFRRRRLRAHLGIAA